VFDGQGKLTKSDGTIYEGNFKDGVFDEQKSNGKKQ